MPRDVRLIRSPISIAGMVLTTVTAVVFIIVLLADLFGLHTNPYVGILFFLVLPALFVLGLLLIPLGAWIERRRRAAGKPPASVDSAAMAETFWRKAIASTRLSPVRRSPSLSIIAAETSQEAMMA